MKPDWVQMSEYMQQLRQLARRAAVHQRLPLTGSELELLARLWMAEEPVTPLGLSRSMGLQQVNVSRLIRGLRARALVAAAPPPPTGAAIPCLSPRRDGRPSRTGAGRISPPSTGCGRGWGRRSSPG